ncbi:MAG TPA: hypothetical protein DEP87_00160 [Candidatus Pacebacteria bacterium]|nr:hypothetical protein [Candidatus Paceibacterota bacterium]
MELKDLIRPETLPVDGYALAAAREPGLAIRARQLTAARGNQPPTIAAILFVEDAGSVLYTRLKREAATRLGIGYQVFEFPISTPVAEVQAKILELNQNPEITGVMIQKPYRGQRDPGEYQIWWHNLISTIDPAKDVDGLTPTTLNLVKANRWQQAGVVLPATCRAVLILLKHYTRIFDLTPERRAELKVAVIGRSELLGLPLAAELKNQKCDVILLGKKDLNQLIEQKIFLKNFDLVITATGQVAFLKGEWLKPESLVVDVGEPRGDVEWKSAGQVASLITPVPGGVGPLTVSSLMENSLDLLEPR